jgi:hypothetical protein
MAGLPTTKKIYRADLGSDIPLWVDNLLSPLNSFIEQVYTAFDKNLTIPENVSSQLESIEFTTKSDYSSGQNFEEISIRRKIPRYATFLLIGNVMDASDPRKKFTTPVFASWSDDNGIIKIRYISGLTNSVKYKIYLLIL